MDDSFALDVYRTLRHAYHRLKRDMREKLVSKGVTWPQFHALYHIDEGHGISVNALARELDCNASNVTGLIDRMIENNWVYREHSKEDRRVWMVKLTDEGRELKARLIPERQNDIRERMAALNDEELATLKTLLEKLMDNKKKGKDV
jgi:DNA-binding MarR family transcriptional regulator